MRPVREFFETLPAKHCPKCNQQIEEMADCYPDTCPECDGSIYYTTEVFGGKPQLHPSRPTVF